MFLHKVGVSMEADIETQKNQDKVDNAIPAIYEMKTGATQRESVTCPRYDDEIISRIYWETPEFFRVSRIPEMVENIQFVWSSIQQDGYIATQKPTTTHISIATGNINVFLK